MRAPPSILTVLPDVAVVAGVVARARLLEPPPVNDVDRLTPRLDAASDELSELRARFYAGHFRREAAFPHHLGRAMSSNALQSPYNVPGRPAAVTTPSAP